MESCHIATSESVFFRLAQGLANFSVKAQVINVLGLQAVPSLLQRLHFAITVMDYPWMIGCGDVPIKFGLLK